MGSEPPPGASGAGPWPYDHPVALVSGDDLRRWRLTVAFRLLLALPHLIWLVLWAIVAILAAVAAWFATLFGGRPPTELHAFLGRFLRYETHVVAYLSLTADPFPRFTGAPGTYPVDLEVAPPGRQNRWKTGFRLILAIPALLFGGALGGGGSGGRGAYNGGIGVLWAGAVLGWFAALATGRMPAQLRDSNLYALRYGAQASGYLMLLTDRYPDADPEAPPVPPHLAPHPIRTAYAEDLRRPRLTAVFRLVLLIPHVLWLTLWSIAAIVAAVAAWFATLAQGTAPAALHRFLTRFIRYATHVYAFGALVADPFPGFTGAPGSAPLDLEVAPPAPQNRWITGFRLVLAIPAAILSSALAGPLLATAFLGWFAAVATGRMPRGLARAGAWAIRYGAQLNAYLFLLTDRYPDATPRIAG